MELTIGDVIYFSESSKNVFSELSENIFGKFSEFSENFQFFSESSQKYFPKVRKNKIPL